MRLASLALLPFLALAADSDRDLSGSWRYNAAESTVRDSAVTPPASLQITQTATAVLVATQGGTINYPLGGKPARSQVGDVVLNIVTKWEGTALLANVLVSGSQNYSIRERWSRAANGARLTIEKTVSRANSETESTLVYDNPNVTLTRRVERAPAIETADSAPLVEPVVGAPRQLNTDKIIVPTGTRILLRLTNAVNTKHTVAGDRLYLETAVPVFIKGQLVIPARSFVTATVLESQRAGRVKGTSGLNFRFDSLTLPNGITRDFRSRAGSVDTRGSLDRQEGRVEGERDKAGDTGKVARTTAAGAGIGTLAGAAAGHVGMGAGIGAAAGALGGLAGVLGSRGADVVMPAGTSMEMVLDREIEFTPEELRTRIQ